MQLPQGATVAVADGEKLNLFHNTSHEPYPKLAPLPAVAVERDNKGSGAGHHSSSANPDDSQIEEDGFSVGVVRYLNRQVLEGKISDLLVIAAPRMLGELRKHYHKALVAKLVGEIAKDLTGHAMHDVEKTIASA